MNLPKSFFKNFVTRGYLSTILEYHGTSIPFYLEYETYGFWIFTYDYHFDNSYYMIRLYVDKKAKTATCHVFHEDLDFQPLPVKSLNTLFSIHFKLLHNIENYFENEKLSN